MKFCSHCGKELTSGEKRSGQCSSCGAKLSSQAQQTGAQAPSSEPTEIDERIFFKTDHISSALMFLGIIGMVFVVILSIAIVNTFGQLAFILFGAAAAGGLALMGIAKCIQYLYEVKQIMMESDNPNPVQQSEETIPSPAPKQKAVFKKDGLSVALTFLSAIGMILVITLAVGVVNDLGPFAFVLFGAAVTSGLTLIGIARCVQYLYEIRQLMPKKERCQADKNDKTL